MFLIVLILLLGHSLQICYCSLQSVQRIADFLRSSVRVLKNLLSIAQSSRECLPAVCCVVLLLSVLIAVVYSLQFILCCRGLTCGQCCGCLFQTLQCCAYLICGCVRVIQYSLCMCKSYGELRPAVCCVVALLLVAFLSTAAFSASFTTG